MVILTAYKKVVSEEEKGLINSLYSSKNSVTIIIN